jgi:hypothetical protein
MEERKIKFRAWTGIEMLNDIIPMNQYAITNIQGFPNTTAQCLYVNVIDTMESIDALDINGKEIYIGDICSANFCAGEKIFFIIIYCKQYACYQLQSINKERFSVPFNSFYKNIEVIGNIYENPELISEA